MKSNAQVIAAKIDHTLLQPAATEDQIRGLCREAIAHEFFGVCINSCWVPVAAKELRGKVPKVISVVGFPLGAMATRAKCFEAEWAIENGAREIDMVISIGLAKDHRWVDLESDIAAVSRVCSGSNNSLAIPLKVILEVGLLTHTEIVQAAQAAEWAGAAFVKTSTGFQGRGAEIADIELLRSTVTSKVKIKASGGIRDLEQAQALIQAGADRLGTSQGIAILKGLQTSGGSY